MLIHKASQFLHNFLGVPDSPGLFKPQANGIGQPIRPKLILDAFKVFEPVILADLLFNELSRQVRDIKVVELTCLAQNSLDWVLPHLFKYRLVFF